VELEGTGCGSGYEVMGCGVGCVGAEGVGCGVGNKTCTGSFGIKTNGPGVNCSDGAT
jgi:hypothetical protein